MKSEMTEEDIKLKYITPAIECKWDKHSQIRTGNSYRKFPAVFINLLHCIHDRTEPFQYLSLLLPNLVLALLDVRHIRVINVARRVDPAGDLVDVRRDIPPSPALVERTVAVTLVLPPDFAI
jgi:hypothetical protein